MRTMTRAELTDFVRQTQIIYGTVERPGLLLTRDNEIVKSFYRRKRLSSSLFLPQARRFVSNSLKLLEKNIRAPIAKEVIYCPDVPVHFVVYDRLDGEDFRELCEKNRIETLVHLPGYLAELHHKGIYFRAVHLGNVLFDGVDLSLLDISDLSTSASPVGLFKRARNIAHLLNTEDDKAYFASYGVSQFLVEYEQAASICGLAKRWFRFRLRLALDDDVILTTRSSAV